MAAKIVPNTKSRGITPGPKLAASPTIQSRTANVKIVQNTALLPNGCRLKNLQFGYGYMALKDLAGHGLRLDTISKSEILPYSSDPNQARKVVCTLIPTSHFVGVNGSSGLVD
jgi:hypothetical protein